MGGEGGSPLPSLKIEKSAPIFEEKRPDYVNLWVKFLIQITVLKVFRKKTISF